MSNFKINFSHPWLLLLLIPAIGVTLFLYFRLSKKYRCTRNRITSIVLHCIIMVLSITVLAGMTFSYNKQNKENEVLLLVDVSDSSNDVETRRNEFVKQVLDESGGHYKIGVVIFGYGQVYAASMSNRVDRVYEQYLRARKPNTSATDIAAALNYAKELFASPQTAKIVLITDGLETDGDALTTVRSVAAEGIQVDTALFSAERSENEAQIIGVTLPGRNVAVGAPFDIELTLQSSFDGTASIVLSDNDTESEPQEIAVTRGVQTVTLEHAFSLPGLHELGFKMESRTDNLTENNTYSSFVYLQIFDRILIVKSQEKEADGLNELLLDNEYNVDVVNIYSDDVPDSLEAIREYDQVILVNVANKDMPKGFIEMLHSYVYEVGGGLLTVGGNQVDVAGNTILDGDNNPVANMYNRADMYDREGNPTLYQQMLPVQAIDYTPPLGLVLLVDCSGSMSASTPSGESRLTVAKRAAKECVDKVMTERDYCGIMSLSTDAVEELPLTSITQVSKIHAAIDSLETGGGTYFTGAIQRAGKVLQELNVQNRHIILITDGAPGDSPELYEAAIAANFANGITISVVGIGVTANDSYGKSMQHAVDIGGGRLYVGSGDNVTEQMKEDLTVPAIKSVVYEDYTPRLSLTDITSGINQADMPMLSGFYGTKKKQDAEVSVWSNFVPLYAQWEYGKGHVGSFMCDLNGTWSAGFLQNAAGQRLINNIIKALFPTEDIRARDIDIALKDDNYSTQMSIYTSLATDESLQITVTGPSTGTAAGNVQTATLHASESFSRFTFQNMQQGLYTIKIEKKNASGTVLSQYVAYKAFSYSAEYDAFADAETGVLLVRNLALNGGGKLITDASGIFAEGDNSIYKVKDPRIPFIIIAIILFLLDIAVRKFKFKWPHEIIREHKLKKLQEKD